MLRWMLLALGTAASLPAHAQLTAPIKNGDTTITVVGNRKPEAEMSNWYVAETPHVIVFSEKSEEESRETALNLEKLHFLLSALLGRLDEPDETIKIAVTMIGDVGAFERLRLTDLRWQYGPFPKEFAKTIYYDPREDGSVLATTNDGINLVLRPSRGRPTNRNCVWGNDGDPPLVSFVGVHPDVPIEEAAKLMPVNELAFCQSAESRLYSGFAQNYLMTYLPAAYPRWFLQGFGEMFATMKAGENFVEYAQLPPGFFQVMEHYGDYPVTHVLDGRYLSAKGRSWTPFHAWLLVHFLYFSDEWKPRLHDYLNALARGADLQSAARAFGNPAQLQRALKTYRGRKLQFEQMSFPPERVPEPSVRRLTQAEAGLIRGRLELGTRIELPAESSRGYSAALARRAAWLERLRAKARQYATLIEHQLLLAEAECRVGNSQECLEAAERVIVRAPTDTSALGVERYGTCATRRARSKRRAKTPTE
jgi:hypothetical protein